MGEKKLENKILLTLDIHAFGLDNMILKKKNPLSTYLYPVLREGTARLCISCLILHYQGIATFQYHFPKQYVKESSIITNLHPKFFLYMIVSVMYILYV